MLIFNHHFYKQKAGVISENALYMVANRRTGHLYGHETILGLIRILLTEYNNDKHLIG